MHIAEWGAIAADAGGYGAWLGSPAAALWQMLHASAPEAVAGAARQLSVASAAVLLALAMDRCWGEPAPRWHPVVLMGYGLEKLGKCIAPSHDSKPYCKPFVLGMMAWCGLVALFFVFYALLQRASTALPWPLQALVLAVLLKPLFAWRMLREEVLAVEQALQRSLPAGRERLTWLVSRDTAQLDAGGVRESAIETLAENLSDSVVAPLLWFALLGLPGAAAYRLANTADAMWGYPGWRGQGAERRHWAWAGKWAARADDVLNLLPARLTAVGLLLGQRPAVWRALRRTARATPSPNGGWPMGAMAHALDVRLGKPGVYVLHPQGQVPQAAHVSAAVQRAGRVVAAVAVLSAATAVWSGVVRYGL